MGCLHRGSRGAGGAFGGSGGLAKRDTPKVTLGYQPSSLVFRSLFVISCSRTTAWKNCPLRAKGSP